MSSSGRLPRLFIGSSTENLDVARTIQETLQYDLEGTVWTQDVFRPTRYTLPELIESMRTHDFAVFVTTPNDALTLRGKAVAAVRDNVIFEIGLFIGLKRPEACFLLTSRSSADAHLPSDLAGLAPILYPNDRSDGNLLAALEPACNAVRRATRLQTQGSPSNRLRRYIEFWEGAEMTVRRQRLRRGVNLDAYDPDTTEDRAALRAIFAFLDSVAHAVLESEIDEAAARATFEQPMRSVWPWIATSLAPPNHSEDYWRPAPSIAVLLEKWK